MADLYIGLNRGQEGFTASDFTVGSSSGSTDMELRIDDSKSLTRLDIVKFLEAVERMVGQEGGVGGLLLDDFGAVV